MNSLDAGFYFAENDRTPLQIASVSVLEGDPPSYGELVRLTLSKLDQLPKYRQRVRTVPFNLARPVWVDDPHFQVLYHGPDALVRGLGMLPAVLATTVHTALLLRQPVIHTVTTTVPGPPFPLYVLGRKLVELYPYIPIATGFRVSIGNISYLGRLYFGLTGDFDAMPDLQVLAGGIRDGFSELAKEAATTSAGVIRLPPR